MYIKECLAYMASGGYPNSHTICTSSEMHVLRLLRHVREEVEGIKLAPKNLEFWFDSPDFSGMIKINPTEDGDLDKNVPGGFFTHREKELF